MRILDPGAGTGELLAAAARRRDDLELVGWDVDGEALAAAAATVPGAALAERSALDPWTGEPFDLVLGNPPYFQLRPTAAQRRRFAPVISGRANVFAFFFQTGLEVLRPGGRLAFIVPPSLNSGAYFEGLREHVAANAEIERLDVLEGTDLFEGANTAVQLIVLRKGSTGNAYRFERETPGTGFRRVIFTADPAGLAACFEGRRTLWELGFEAVTGTIVWNQHRDALTTEPGGGPVPLFWSHNLRGGELVLGNRPGKPQYIRAPGAVTKGPAILVNRVVGAVGHGELRTALVPEGEEFLAENHVNVIRPRLLTERSVSWEELDAMLKDPEAAERVRKLTGNTQISAKELTHLLPLGP